MTTQAGFGEAVRFLRSLQPEIEGVLRRGLERVAAIDDETVSLYNQRRSFEEQFNLMRGEDCCYDRPGTGFAYASWYHPRRVHDLVRRFLPLIREIPSGTIVLDLGAGTGATAWALGLAGLASAAAGDPVPDVLEVLAVDTSPSMLAAAEVMWEALQAWRPVLGERVRLRPVARPWIDPPAQAKGGWVVAGHLFDATDSDDEVHRQFRRMLLRVQPVRVLIDAPEMKQLHLLAAVAGSEGAGWQNSLPPTVVTERIWAGPLTSLATVRRSHLDPTGDSPAMLNNDPRWDGGPQVIRADLVPAGAAGDRLFALGPIGLVLDDDQDEAAEPRERFEVLIGAAGSGKSVVLVERVVRTVKASLRAGEQPHVLVTTRNVPMVDQLHAWSLDRLERDGNRPVSQPGKTGGDHLVRWSIDHGTATIRFLNWDKVPTRLFGPSLSVSSDTDAIRVRIQDRLKQGWPAMSRHAEYLQDYDWLAAELRRVIHGQRLRTKDEYLAAARVGRVKPLPPQIRESVWALLMEPSRQTSFTDRWMQLVDSYAASIDADERIVIPAGDQEFTHAFVDEVQDFTATDLKFVAAMLPDAQRLYCVGDGGQAMLLGACFDVPGMLRGRRRDVRNLSHSYRMSRRVAEAVQPLAQAILDTASQGQQRWVGVPTGTRSGVLGCRPIVLVRQGTETEQLHDVLVAYAAVFDRDTPTITIAEGRNDSDLVEAAKQAVPMAGTRVETMARIKGLERTCVVWSTGSRWKLDESAAEFVHTVLTRATSLVVIVLDPDHTDSDILEALGQLRRDRLLFWTSDAEKIWSSLVG